MQKRCRIIYNPTSGREAMKNNLVDILNILERAGYETSAYATTPEPNSAKNEAERAAKAGFNLIVAAGGDGTINEVVNGIAPLKHRPKLGIIPAGTTNDYARALKIPREDPIGAAKVIAKGQTVKMDIGEAGKNWFVNIAAGNLMSGIFYKDGPWTGVVEFGQPYNWTARPSGMKVKYHATLGTIDASKHSGAPVGIGDPDKARIFVAIIDWNARHRVASGTKDPTGIWDPAETIQTAEGKLIAYGSLFVDKSTEGEQMVEATLPLNFYDPAAGRPTGKYSIIISCSTSAYGDYMVGCTTNVMYVDDFQWVY